MSNQPTSKRSGEGPGIGKGGPTTIGRPSNSRERILTESSSTAPVGQAPGAEAETDGTKDGQPQSTRHQAVAGSTTTPPTNGPTPGPSNHAEKDSRRRHHKARRHHHKKKAKGESAREELSSRSRRRSRYDFDDDDGDDDDDDDNHTDAAAPSYYDDALDYDDDGRAAVTAMLRAAGVSQTTSCQRPHVDTYDCDTLYLLSLRDSFKRLSASQKSTAMIRIQTALHEIEFGKPEV
ncbi:hypothetical protein HPB48_020346 [Haemaphysalis longicornis]|uniref:BESS domain-containing protein n=1 Tax=Haemaphysalis longicornis TaxID=44386 RepID=A0A9J6GNS5_HAELO|nr:hypothetical protein HPB48_020346 [Haemaphysalis longicornis]